MATTTTAISAEGRVRSMKLCGHCKNRGKKRICDFYTVVSNYAEKCKDFEEKKQTNADRIRAMSDEELAELLTDENFQTNVSNEFCGHLCKNSSTEGCLLNLEKEPCPYTEKDDMIEWLQSEVEE